MSNFRRRLLINNNKVEDHKLGDIAYVTDYTLKFINYDDWEDTLGTPIAICVIPTSHAKAFNNGSARFISVTGVDLDGSPITAEKQMAFGEYGVETGFTKYAKVPTWDNTIGGVIDSAVNGYMSSDGFTGPVNVIDTKTNYYRDSVKPLIPSPYNTDDSFYDDFIRVIEGNNALSDLDGKANTKALLSLSANYISANACANYKTIGTIKGDWYLPALGELVYLIPRFTLLNTILSKINGTLLVGNTHGSSTELDVNKIWINSMAFGAMSGTSKSSSIAYIRPFIQFGNSIDVSPKFIKKDDYLYETTYNDINYVKAKNYFESGSDQPVSGGCSAKREGTLVGRNFDMTDDHRASVVVHTPSINGRQSVIGTCCLGSVTNYKIDNKSYSITELDLLPFYLVDGVNSSGLYCSSNVVPTWNNTTINPLDAQTDKISERMLVRYILDHYTSVDNAIDDLTSHIQIYMSQALQDGGYELHYFLADNTKSVILEFVDNTLKVIEQDKITNFHLYGVTPSEDGSIYIAADIIKGGHYPSENGIERYGNGLERFKILNSTDATTIENLQALMRSVFYTKTYTNLSNVWDSELVGNDGVNDITIDTVPFDPILMARFDYAREKYNQRTKDNAITWRTTHSAVYNLVDKKVYIESQENGNVYEFALEENNTL